ncbi:MAG: glycosyltransferase [Candidatus Gygaella obscura]|nr:glycosyltransferase [Candidatus Gygaella obscura]
MKILVIYATAGAGHRRAAEAIYNYLIKDKNHEVKKIDALDYSNRFFKYIYSQGYLFVIKRLQFIWIMLFYAPVNKISSFFANAFRFLVNRINLFRLVSYILKEKPDCIVSAHFLPNEVAAFIKRFFKVNFRVVSIVTDFTVHPFWVTSGVDEYIVASEKTKKEIIQLGVKEASVRVIGIPIDEKFLNDFDRKIIAQANSLDSEKFTVIVVTGAIGVGPIEQIARLLSENKIQTIVVCGKNKILLDKLNKARLDYLKPLGFVDNMHELMSIADVIVTKPGGLSVSESLAKKLFMIFISPIPGQETANAFLMQELGVGVSIDQPQSIVEKIIELKNDPQKLESIKEKFSAISKKTVLEEIKDEICRSGGWFTD